MSKKLIKIGSKLLVTNKLLSHKPKTDSSPDTYFNEYGGLYNWWAMDGLASDGWRVSLKNDITTLVNYIDNEENGGELKSTRTEPDPHPRWDEPNIGTTNAYNFSALPSGARLSDSSFNWLGHYHGIWTSEEETENNGAVGLVTFNHWDVVMPLDDRDKRAGLATRVVRDATANEQNSEHEDYMEEGVIQENEYTGHNGKTYDAVRIGNQVWITENLKETKRKVNDELYKLYGYLYNKHAVDDERDVANTGWHVPTMAEWSALEDYVNNNYQGVIDLKSEREEPDEHPRWRNTDNVTGNNTLNMSILPTGYREDDGSFASMFHQFGHWLCWAPDGEYDNAVYFNYSTDPTFRKTNRPDNWGSGIRLVRYATDEEKGEGEGGEDHEDFIGEGVIQTDMYEGNDGKKYDCVRIDDKIWMAEQLRETRYNNNDIIPQIQDDTQWDNLDSGAYCVYPDTMKLVDIPYIEDGTTWSELTTAAMCAYPK